MARKKSCIGTFTELWKAHEKLYLDIFCRALSLLTINNEQRKEENIISRALCPILRQICFNDGNGVAVPKWELPIPPDSGDEEKTNQKRPDFTCSLTNSTADSAETYEIPLHIECKRLGDKSSSSWYLNKNYVGKGINRFDDNEYNYGKYAPSGIMIGYIVNSTKGTILTEVNSYLSERIDPLEFVSIRKLDVCESKYKRNVIEPFDFTLHHIWVDVREESIILTDNLSND
ncbi:MAG: hypothetical protein Ta2B_19820 [Termitinemataceae bacterium]|nr:MAG: hypothetical protein Ta2B_19820 [Termitinemataceae bacterium]